jgi:hypothetical protein
MKLLDFYFRRPVLIDYIFTISVSIGLFYVFKKGILELPLESKVLGLASDIGTIGLTVSGFVLTLLTILITLKNGEDSENKPITKSSSAFQIYFASPLYFQSIKILKNAVISLVLISILNYFAKIVVSSSHIDILFFINVTGLIIICTTFLRSLLILTKIVKMQRKPEKH